MTTDRHAELPPASQQCRIGFGAVRNSEFCPRDRLVVFFLSVLLVTLGVSPATAQDEPRSSEIPAQDVPERPDSLDARPLPGAQMADSVRASTDPGAQADSIRIQAMLDSLARVAGSAGSETPSESAPRSTNGFQDPFADPFETDTTGADWDSVFAAYDRQLPTRTFEPLADLRYSKAEGVHLEAGVEYGPNQGRRFRIAASGGYDFGRERPIGSARVQVGDLERWRGWVTAEARDGARAFGSHRPYGNTIFALVGGYDAQNYLRERAILGQVHWQPYPTLRSSIGFSRREHSPLPVSSTFHILGPDHWMERNDPAERVDLNTLFLEIERRPRYSLDVVRPGLYLHGSGALTGGNGLRGDREFSRVELQGRYLWLLNEDRDELYIYADGGVAPGRPPVQEWFDVGGAGGLRAFEPRSFVGTSRYLLRSQFAWEDRLLRRSGIPLIETLRFHLVPFAEVGSAWGTFVPQTDWELPKRRDVHWDLGFGIRRVVESSGVLSFLQVDFAWPMGADSGPARITVQLSRRGFDS